MDISKYGTYIAIGVSSAALMGLGVAAVAGAADNTTTAATTSTAAAATGTAAPDQRGPGGQRSDETLVTGALKTTLTKAAQAKYAGATIDRVETEADGNGVYEAHITKADGSQATVYFDKDGAITSTEDGMGGGPAAPPAA